MIGPATSGIWGCGVDLIEINRIADSMERWGNRFLDRLFSAAEQAYCRTRGRPAAHFAARFAAKEAVSKAFGTGIGQHLQWLDICVHRGAEDGPPRIQLSDQAAAWARTMGAGPILISLTHTREYALAQALILTGRHPADASSETSQ